MIINRPCPGIRKLPLLNTNVGPQVRHPNGEAREQHLALAGFSFLPVAISVVAVAVRIAIRIAVGVAVRVAVYRTNT